MKALAINPRTVYGSLMHHRAEWAAMQEQAGKAPYNKLPTAPVLYIKPANTFLNFDQALRLPPACTQVQARACLALIFESNHSNTRIKPAGFAIKTEAATVRQMALFCDFTQAQPSWYRPPLRFNAFDGSLALPACSRPADEAALQTAVIETWVNGQCAHRYSAADWVCSAQDQLQAVSRFIAWEDGDVLMLGCPPDAPWVRAGDVVQTRWSKEVFTRTTVLAGEQA
jgi:5-oxopent-3-ene-1,2,5-tricarboxylate decarboxylase / 2-hydroxyhepta-2,4-diene-1,7-dioate isomerase